MSIVGEYYTKEVKHEWNRAGRGKHNLTSKGRTTPTLQQLREKLDLKEDIQQVVQGLNDIILPATEFIKQQISDRAQLPDDAPEVSFLNGLLGVIQQGTPVDGEDLDQGMLREKINIMADKLESMVGEDAHGDHGMYASKLVSGLRRFSNRIDPADDSIGGEEGLEGEEGMEGGEEGGEGDLEMPAEEGGEEGAEGEEGEEPEEDEASKLSRELGIS